MPRPLIRLLQIVLPLGVLGISIFAAYTMVVNRPPVVTQPPIIAPPGVRVHPVTFETVRLTVQSQGTVRPRTESQLVPEINGLVTWVSPSFAEGGFFEADELLMKIDPFDYQQATVSARSQLAQARLRQAQEQAEAEVAEREWQELGVGDPRELTLRKPQLEDARAAVAAAEANLVRAERDLERAEIKAPYAGRVRRKNVDVGQFVTVGSAVATIYAVDVAEIRLPLPDEELAYLNLPLAYRGTRERPGPRVTIRTTFAGRTHEWEGRIVRTESELDPETRMVHAIAEVIDPYAASSDRDRPPLAVGMYVEAEIEGRQFPNISVLPRAALQGRSQVLLVDDGQRLGFRDVDILRSTTESIYVSAGLAEGELVTISAIDGPTEGMIVQLTDGPAGSAGDLMASREGAAPVTGTAPETDAAAVAPTQPNAEQTAATASGASSAVWLDELIAEVETATPAAAPRPPAPRPAVRTVTSRSRPPAPAVEPAAPTLAQAVDPPRSATSPAPDAPDVNAVAVLPFVNLTRQPGDAGYGATITDTISTRLASIARVTVVRREADASWVIWGGVQRLGDVIRITARVVDGTSGAVLRAVKVDGSIEDLSRLGDQVASELTDSVREALDDAAREAV